VRATGLRRVGSEHLKMTLTDGAARLEGIGFGMAERQPELEREGGPLDVAFRLEENRWNGRTTLQARLVELRPAG
jgi:single-stranded-DNA-specific exonuclease